MITVRAPLPGEVMLVASRAAETWVRDLVLAGQDLTALFSRPLTRVMLVDDHPVAAGGFVDYGDGTAIGWTLVGQPPLSSLVALIRAFRREIISTPFHTIEAHCFDTFPASHRWVQCIGFKPSGAPCFAPDGRAFVRFIFRNDHDGR